MLKVQIKKQLSHFLLDVDFRVGAEIVALLGPSGSGKTTILNCISGITSPDEGRIQLGEDLFYEAGRVKLPIQERKIGYLFQDYALFPHQTVWKNIIYGAQDEEFAKALMTDLRIAHLQGEYPHHISGGEKQRVALARALASQPRALLLDEPLSALDDLTRTQAQQELLQIHERWKIPTIIVTHDLTEARRLAGRILYLQDGILVEDEGLA